LGVVCPTVVPGDIWSLSVYNIGGDRSAKLDRGKTSRATALRNDILRGVERFGFFEI